MKDTTALLDTAYKECENKIKNNMSTYKKWLSKFMNVRSKQLYANAPYEQIYFTANDVAEFFSATKIDREKVNDAIHHTYYWEVSNFNPSYAKDDCTMTMLCLVRYFKLKNMKKELELALISLCFSGKMYPSVWYGSFPVTAPQENIMDYTVNNLCNNKFDIVREGNVIGAVKSIALTWCDAYQQKFKEFHDDDAVYLIQQIHNRIRSFMNNIAELYYQAYENKDYMTYDSDDVSEDNYHLADSDTFKLERTVSATMNYLNTHGINYKICKTASNENVKMDEIKSIIENILADNKNMPLVREYVTILVATYYQQSKTKDVLDLDFVTYSITAKPNSKNKYELRRKEILDTLLLNNSEHFARRRNRFATEQAYYRAFNAYMALTIQEANK